MTKFTITNIAGGNRREFTWSAKAGLSMRALRHAAEIGPPSHCVFSGPAGQQALEEYDEIYDQYIAGECSDVVEAIFTR